MEMAKVQYAHANAAEYGEKFGELVFISEAEAAEGEGLRRQLLADIGRAGGSMCALGSKFHSGALSPGCRCCVEGGWSCLFINNICNGGCFYCPTSQRSKSEPATNTLNFARVQDYLDYLGTFGFRGASVSGGEPLLTFDRTLSYVDKVKKRFGAAVHLWLYTNGILASGEKIAALAAAGLDEIRFDISAVDYSLEKAALAAGSIPTVTVEIPAIPEDYGRLRDLLPQMADSGVKHLNLHQMRCTPHNMEKLAARGYRFVHGPKVLVYESELAALRLLLDAQATGRGPAVNYCSFAYKSRFQALAARRRAAAKLVHPYEDITEAGYIRNFALRGPSPVLDAKVAALQQKNAAGAQWRREGPERLACNAVGLGCVGLEGTTLQIAYSAPRLCERPSLKGSVVEARLNRGRTIVAERRFVEGFTAASEEQAASYLAFLAGDRQEVLPESGLLGGCMGYERLPSGLFPYVGAQEPRTKQRQES